MKMEEPEMLMEEEVEVEVEGEGEGEGEEGGGRRPSGTKCGTKRKQHYHRHHKSGESSWDKPPGMT